MYLIAVRVLSTLFMVSASVSFAQPTSRECSGGEQADASPPGTIKTQLELDTEKLERVLEALCNKARSENGGSALNAMQELAEKGNASAQFRMGQIKALSSDKNAAAIWWRRASTKGYARATFALGNLSSDQSSPIADQQSAIKYYRLAIDQGWKTPLIHLRLARALLLVGQVQDCTSIREHLEAAITLREAQNVLLSTEFRGVCDSPPSEAVETVKQ